MERVKSPVVRAIRRSCGNIRKKDYHCGVLELLISFFRDHFFLRYDFSLAVAFFRYFIAQRAQLKA